MPVGIITLPGGCQLHSISALAGHPPCRGCSAHRQQGPHFSMGPGPGSQQGRQLQSSGPSLALETSSFLHSLCWEWKDGILESGFKEVLFPPVTQTQNDGLINSQRLKLSAPPSLRLLEDIYIQMGTLPSRDYKVCGIFITQTWIPGAGARTENSLSSSGLHFLIYKIRVPC